MGHGKCTYKPDRLVFIVAFVESEANTFWGA